MAFCRITLRKADLTTATVTVGTGTPETGREGDVPPPTLLYKVGIECIFIREGPIVASDTARLCFVASYSKQALPQSTGFCIIALGPA